MIMTPHVEVRTLSIDLSLMSAAAPPRKGPLPGESIVSLHPSVEDGHPFPLRDSNGWWTAPALLITAAIKLLFWDWIP
ncbi:hypothetical protein TNIN_427811 [Trichonephila inaurata madagascariensis]|uniref:Uncharacterized protein n=1 Tax=Trichonephila inaurata madagascariensis TaxID=2747483 RepID=A0A8X7C945_9ARAC|nr:hypothetical protein TNIN_427811 [Trichonephila inaurata madagascariensis]